MLINKSNQITVIGSNGGIGAAIVDELVINGYTNIVGITISGQEKYGRNIKVVQADAMDKDSIINACSGSSVIFGAFNASVYSDASWAKEFPLFMDNFIECGVANNAKLIFLDNLYSYQNLDNSQSYDENSPIVPYNTKGQIRKNIANQFLAAIKDKRIQGNIIKSSDLYGPYALNSVIGDRYFETLFQKNKAEIIPLGNNPHSLTYTRDVGKIALITAFNNNQPTIIHTPNSPAIGYEDMVRMTYKYLDFVPKESKAPMYMFHLLSLFIAPIKSMLGMMYQWNKPFVIKSIYNQDFVPTPLEAGIEATVKWFKQLSKE